MGTLILIFIIVFIIWPVVKTFYRINKARKAARDMFNNAYGAGAGFGTQAQQSRKPGWSDAPARKKKITKDVGEYVSFQEIPADPASPPAGNTFNQYESQVSDAEWEDIK